MSEAVKSVCVPARQPSRRVVRNSIDRYAELRALGQDPLLDYQVTLDRIYRETDCRLDTLFREVREGKDVMEASRFVRWLQFCGVLDVLERHCLPGQDFTALRKKVQGLIAECGEHFRGGRVEPKYAASDIAEIKEELRELRVLLVGRASESRADVERPMRGGPASRRFGGVA